MKHKIEIYQQTLINDIATLTISDDELAELNTLREKGDVYKVREFLLECANEADEWTRGDDIDADLPHYYEVDGKQFSAVDLS